jgi:hypothetical protein
MASRFYQFDYAEMNGFDIANLGILNIQCDKDISSEYLKEYTRQYLKHPSAHIVISNITKLTKTEYELITGKKIF